MFRKWLTFREGHVRAGTGKMGLDWWDRLGVLCREARARIPPEPGDADYVRDDLETLAIYSQDRPDPVTDRQGFMNLYHTVRLFASHLANIDLGSLEVLATRLANAMMRHLHAIATEGKDYVLVCNIVQYGNRSGNPPWPSDFNAQWARNLNRDMTFHYLRVHEANIPNVRAYAQRVSARFPQLARDLDNKTALVFAMWMLRDTHPDQRLYHKLLDDPFDGETWLVAADWMEDNDGGGSEDYRTRLRKFIQDELIDSPPARTEDGYLHWGVDVP